MDANTGRRGKRRRSGRLGEKQVSDLLRSFVPVRLLDSLNDMTCTVQGSVTACEYLHCEHCSHAFCTETGLASHTREEHPEAAPAAPPILRARTPPLQCAACRYCAPDANKAVQHERAHKSQRTGEHVVKCGSCGFLSSSQRGITIHKRLEHAPGKYSCPMCSYASYNARHVTAHVDSEHCVTSVPPSPTKTVPSTPSSHSHTDTLDCPYCDTQFNQGVDLKEHLAVSHVDESLFKEYTCAQCDYISHTNTDIYQHMHAHRAKKRVYKCSYCAYISLNEERYLQHLQKVHHAPAQHLQEHHASAQHLQEVYHVPALACPSRTELTPPVVTECVPPVVVEVMDSPVKRQNIPVIRVVSGVEERKEVDIQTVIYTPPTSPIIKSDPGNIFDRMNLKAKEKERICKAVGLKMSPRRKYTNSKLRDVPKISNQIRSRTARKSKMSSNHGMVRKSLKRCRYCGTKTMFDSLTKLREHHIKAHGINELAVQFSCGRQYKCKYCEDNPEFEGLQALKEHYAERHPNPSLRKLIKRPRSKNFSDDSVTESELPKLQPSLEEQIEIARTSCETKKLDMLEHIREAQKQLGQPEFQPDCFEPPPKSRVARFNSAPSSYETGPVVKQVPFSPDTPVSFRSPNSAPATPLRRAPSLENPPIKSPTEMLAAGGSIYNMSLHELQYLHQCYIYQAYCMNMYYTDPAYRRYVQEKRSDTDKECDLLSTASCKAPSPSLSRPPAIKISNPRSLAHAGRPAMELTLTKPTLRTGSPSPDFDPSLVASMRYTCFVSECMFRSRRLIDLKTHVADQHNIKISAAMMSEWDTQIRRESAPSAHNASEEMRYSALALLHLTHGASVQPPPRAPSGSKPAREYKCTHCSTVCGSFESYVQHLIEEHRAELGIASQGEMSHPAKGSVNQTGEGSGGNVSECTSPNVILE